VATQVDLCNLALALLGQEAISSINEDSRAGRLCRQFYAQVYDEVLRSHAWKCAKARSALAELVTTPDFGWDHAFQLPADCLRALWLEELDYEFDVEQGQLLTNDDEANLVYIARVTPNKLDSWAAKAIYHSLAVALAYPLTQSLSLKQSLESELETRILPEARRLGAFESLEPESDHSGWLNERV
jgi:hypothetical protein